MIQSKLELGLTTFDEPAPPVACGELPQQRFDAFGVSALSDTELVALVLQSGIRGQTVMSLASRLIAEAGTVAGLAAWQAADYRRLAGIGAAKAKQLVAVAEIARRMMRPAVHESPVLNRPELIAEYLRPVAYGLEVEKFWVLCLNRRNRLKKLVEISSGTAVQTLASPREVFRAAIKEAATAVVVAHNHPSGDCQPSAADVSVTRTLKEAARTVDIELIDHVILGLPAADPRGVGHFSFREAGVL